MGKPRVRVEVLQLGTQILNIIAADLKPGDVWLGDSEVKINWLHEGPVTEYYPAGSDTSVTGPLVGFTGEIIKGKDRGHRGSWSVQPGQPMEVRRHA